MPHVEAERCLLSFSLETNMSFIEKAKLSSYYSAREETEGGPARRCCLRWERPTGSGRKALSAGRLLLEP